MSRSINFTNYEIDLIVNEMEEFPELVSKEFTKRLPNKKEHQLQWEALAKKLSAVNMGIPRTGNQVRNKWNDLKYRIKQKSMKLKKHYSATGGGPPKLENLLPYEQRIIAILGNRCTEGITDEFSDTSTLVLQKLKKINTTSSASQSQQPLLEVILTESDNATSSASQSQQPLTEVILTESDNATSSASQSQQPLTEVILTESDNATSSASQSQQPLTEVILTESDNVIPDAEKECILTYPTSVYENVQTPRSWPIHKSNNSSTRRGQLHRQRKRKRAASVLEDFESEALETQRNMCKEVKALGENMAAIVPILAKQQQDTTTIKDVLVCLNKNIEKLTDKIEENNKLLSHVLHGEK